MNNFFEKTIKYTFYIIFFATPLIFYPYTSELFEFNKIILVYLATIVIVSAWIGKMIVQQKIIFSRTILDIPLLIFLCSQILSTITSIDQHTSLFGYYGRFNGGLISLFSYSLLFWAFVSNMKKPQIKNSVYALLASAFLVSIYAFFEHYGKSVSCLLVTGKFNVDCWVQDVQNRVFATLGQPNWLAAWLVALIPFTWSLTITSTNQNKFKRLVYPYLFVLFFVILLYTKSRSGLLGLFAAFVVFWSLTLWKNKVLLKSFLTSLTLLIVAAFLIGTPWTKNLNTLLINNDSNGSVKTKEIGPALETGGTESAEIRKIVWKGAIDVWKNYPLFGSGVETFAYSFYEHRPKEHNLVSEWDFLYNKAHNEYLNFAATTGTLGLLSYLIFIGTVIYFLFKNSLVSSENKYTSIALLAGFISILITNFFGFSVVTVSLLTFLFPAFSISFIDTIQKEKQSVGLSSQQKVLMLIIATICTYLTHSTTRYWYADFLYAKAQNLSRSGKILEARNLLLTSVKISPNQAIYLNELAITTGSFASSYHEKSLEEKAKETAAIFDTEIQQAISLSPRNLNIKRNAASWYTKLSGIDSSFLIKANTILKDSEALSPTDPRIKLNLAGTHIRLGDKKKAEELLNQVVTLKPNYKEGRYALAAILADRGEKEKAIEHLSYILTEVDPTDKNFKTLIEDIEKQ